MQGQRSAVGSLPEVLGFDHGSTSSDSSLDQPIRWNTMRNTAQSRAPDYMITSSDATVGYLNAVNQPAQSLSGWDFGESSSRVRQGEVSENAQKTESWWVSPMNVCTGSAISSDGQQCGSSGSLSLNHGDVNVRSSDNATGTFSVQNSGSDTNPRDLNMNSDFVADEDDDCQVVERPDAFKSVGSVRERMPSASSSSSLGMTSVSGGYLAEDVDGRPGCSLDGRRLSCKRKTLEGNAGQSSGSGSSNHTQHAESSLWHAIPARHGVSNNFNTATSSESNLGINLHEPVNPRLGLSVGQVSTENCTTQTVSGTAESSRRNFRLRINASHQQDSVRSNSVSMDTDIGNSNISSVQHSFRMLPQNNSMELRQAPVIENGNPQGQPLLVHVSSSRRNPLRWNGSSGTRPVNSSGVAIPGAAPYEESTSASVPRNISEHPMFLPPNDMRNLSQNPASWNLAGGNINNPMNVASSSRSPSLGVPSSAPTWTPHRNPTQFPRRLSEYVRRAAPLSSGDTEAVGQSSNYPLRSVASSSQDINLPPGPSTHGRHAPSSRSAMLLERHLEGALGVPYSLRTLGGAPEGRSRLMSEIRNVLDLMRRGEGLRFEDVMILDQSVFLGMSDIHDRHRDMRLDVDNMSYEELLALEERIGNVNTGLAEEIILKQLKQRKHARKKSEDVETEPCCICQEEYINGDQLGTLDCGHDFHAECIKQWLTHKNLCPICKTTGLSKS
ncbi:OLC1v1016805C1 [Oldenlandia corymbosa var. corymbosa]|uniref:RING-type E3 ubiquitin transferase n=1 Tax=Oldenlandia corymbosa var. corymbosa TaxID=529605 RepID=A0AAV1E7Y3_OLDCO|nr:OLC1v1016805C1 [Oldenlandia corymbosa var. corymbosa]